MKTIVSKLSVAVIGTIVMAGAHAATTTVTSIGEHARQGVLATNNFNRASKNVTVQSYDIGTSDGGKFLALCIEPTVAMDRALATTYSVSTYTGFANNVQIQRLFSEYYDDALASTSASLSFQLALWELNNDTGGKLVGTGADVGAFSFAQVPSTGNNKVLLTEANNMVNYALSNAAITQTYTYTLFQSASSQSLVAATISAVPEPSTYAMLGLGLALVGFAARRRKQG
ncbi:PEP-CTERM sorting domain-containing protein [Massilia dura]|uniref:PEP-CTERM sorting domain-containing protein n=1 Tax=Pseudoduganella dura TaxID=321982 RepID=A0A6I3X2K2_9BURK|nr:PEP-CTERM sorting domain-containing protein [Pseudoduganella dura]MUI11049.1 PEP-CTERM sorting domain-containing protein [Pseudoduganella dura]GGY14149.1 hypothetical protein GCM10007386_50390 [Pseudoduganella dura]